MVKIRLQRFGARNQPFYRIVVIERRERRNGKPIEALGTYNPLTEPPTVVVDRKRFDHWTSVGAQISDPVRMLVLGEKLKHKKEPRRAPQEKEAPAPEPKAEQAAAPTEETLSQSTAEPAVKSASQGEPTTDAAVPEATKEQAVVQPEPTPASEARVE